MAIVLAGLLALGVPALLARAPRANADVAGLGGDYVPFTIPSDVLDTRSGLGTATGKVAADSVTPFQVLGVGGVPASGVRAVFARIVAIAPEGSTSLSLYPDGASRPIANMLQVYTDASRSNAAVVAVGGNGKIVATNSNAKTHLVVQIQGYFRTTAGGVGGGFVPLDHTPIVDTRSALGTTAGKIPANGSRTITLSGLGGIPATASAVFVDVIAIAATAYGSVTAVPPGTTTTRAVIQYALGNSSSSAVIKLPADGRIVFANNGAGAIDLALRVQGYFTTSTTTGAGLRMVSTVRIIDTRSVGSGAPLAANATVDVQVGGVRGLPTRGIASALLNVLAVSPSEAGNLKAWPVGATETTSSLANHPAGQHRNDLIAIKLGTDGKIRIRNSSTGTVHVIVELQGYFADPLPGVAITQAARVDVMQKRPAAAALYGTVEYSYVNNIGQVFLGHQTDPNAFGSVQWTALSGNEAFTGPVALAELPDTRLQIAAQHTDSNVRDLRQSGTTDPPAWGAWVNLGGSMASPPVVGRLTDGSTVLFAVDADGKLWQYRQSLASPFWQSLGSVGLSGPITVAVASTGLRLIGRDSTGAVKTAVYATDGSMSAWTSLGGAGLASLPTAVVYPGYRTRLFARAANGTVSTQFQNADGTWPATWTAVGTLATAGAPAAILDPVVGRAAVVVRGADNEIYVSWETSQGSGTFGSWNPVALGSDPTATDPTVAPFNSANGQSWIIVFRNLNDATRVYWRDPSSIPPAGVAAPNMSGRTATSTGFVANTLPAPPKE